MNLLAISSENFDFCEIRETEVESGLIAESEHLFMDAFAEEQKCQSANNPGCNIHNISVNVPPNTVLPAKVCGFDFGLSQLYIQIRVLCFFVISIVFSGSWKS